MELKNKLKELRVTHGMTQEAVADKYTAMSEIVAEINAAAGIKQAGIHAGATKYAADLSSSATRYASDQSKAASEYATDHTKTGLLSDAIIGVIDGLTGNEGSGKTIGDYTSGAVSKFKGLFRRNSFSGKVAGRRGDK